MATTVTPVTVTTDTFETWVTRTNTVIDIMSNYAVTANNEANGSLTTGNGFVNGIFGANTIVVPAEIRGGNVQSSQPLVIGQSASQNNSFTYTIGNSTVNNFANSTVVRIGTATVNIQSTGSLLSFNASATVNSQVNSTYMVFNASATTNAQINSTAFRVQNSTVTFDLTKPTASQVSDADFFIASDGTWKTLETVNDTSRITGSTSGTSEQKVDDFLKASWNGGEYLFYFKDNAANSHQTGRILVLHDDNNTDAFVSEYGRISSNALLGSFTATANTTHVLVNFTPTVAATNYTLRRTLIT
jgi:hypothetical protein